MVTGRSWSAERPSGRVTVSEGSCALWAAPTVHRTQADTKIIVMRSELRAVRTGGVPAVVDLTGECAEFVRPETDGLLHVFVPHATAGIAILETGAGSDDDLLAQLDVLLPRDDRWRHRHGSPGHGRDHVVPAFIPPHASVPVLEGRMQLGTWQRICLVDTNTDNHQRHVRFSFLAG
jgi:secondary thiamine-phosphate synthase enzyme